MESSSPEFLIVGGGLAGLSAAGFLQRNNREVLILEASDEVGGRVRTDVVDGFRLDRGFQVLLTAYPELSKHLDLGALDLQMFEPGALIFRDGSFDQLVDPFRRPTSLPRAIVSSSLTLKDKLLLLSLRRRLARMTATSWNRSTDTSIATELEKIGFSSTAIDQFFNPLLSGIQLTQKLEGSGRLGFLILRTLFAGDAAVPAGGMAEIPRQLASVLPTGTIRTSCPVEKIEGRTVFAAHGQKYRPKTLIMATDGPTATQLLGIPLKKSRPQSCAYFAAPTAPCNSQAIILDGESRGPARNVAVLTNVAPSYGPQNSALIATVFPGTYDPDCADLVKPQMRLWFGDQVDNWEHLRTYTIAHGQPVFEVGSSMRSPNHLGDNRFICGDHRDTPSIQGALVSGRRLAEELVGLRSST